MRVAEQRRGATLLELVLAVAIITVLLAAILILLQPQAEITRTYSARALHDAKTLTEAVRLFALDKNILPHAPHGFPAGGSATPICTETSTLTTCIDLRALKTGGFIPLIPVYQGVADENVTGFFYRVCNGGDKFVDIVIADEAGSAVPCP